MKKFAVVIGGCGHKDGSEIQETVSALLAMSKAGIEYQCFSVDCLAKDYVNHITDESDGDVRNLLTEAARIARGDIKPLNELNVQDFDALVLPGGFGVAKNYMSYAFDGVNGTIRDDIKAIILDFHKSKKYIGAICISPVLLAFAFKDSGIKIKITVGTTANRSVFDHVEKLGGEAVAKESSEICIDAPNRIVTTPAYMNDASIFTVYTGIELLINHIAENS
ncbi:MAG: isoprenoid biosynthesis protein ElbB [Candidatus Cloacimonadota bacterium]|nr:MAG: isoprenoid biosynthesis protein ElbB [Candidatus Cloacimonadota bacterium]PIE77591.1 MAG: isoprenoid biosynthesis protein ElbB [Candidatus Delongbacteria bacterium]